MITFKKEGVNYSLYKKVGVSDADSFFFLTSEAFVS